jgi:hypothetical protein
MTFNFARVEQNGKLTIIEWLETTKYG